MWTLAQLAEHLNAELWGDGRRSVRTVCHPDDVQHSDELALILQPDALSNLSPHVELALLPDGLPLPEPSGLQGALRVKRPRLALAQLLQLFEPEPALAVGVHPTAVIEAGAQVDLSARIGALVYVGANAVIGPGCCLLPHVSVGAGAQLGAHCLLHAGVRLGERVVLGERVIVHHNASIGADGFSYVTPEPGSIESAKAGGEITAQNQTLIRIPSIGTVIIEDDVEIGACSTIDRANVGATRIRRGTKIDNLVMIGHNNQLGESCLIAGQVGIAGSCIIGNRVVMAGQVGLADHLSIGDDAILMAQAGVNKSVPAKAIMLGAPAVPRKEAAEQFAGVARLKHLRQEVRQLRRELQAMEARLNALVPKSEPAIV